MSEDQKEFLEGTEEANKDVISWDEACASTSMYFKPESGVRQQITITAWSFSKELVNKFKSDEKEEKYVLNAKVVAVNGEDTDLIINTSSARFKDALRPFLEDKEPAEKVTVSFKKIGKDTDTTYDVELPQ